MFRPISIVASTLGIAANLTLWSVPLLVGASAVPTLLSPHNAPTLAQALTSAEHNAGQTPGLLDGLTQLIGAESEALDVAGAGLAQPTSVDLGPRAEHASGRVLDAVSTYVRSASAALHWH
jgi:hypothetical protein